LQQIAYNLGIEKSVRNMTQAEKAQLRTIAIYEQSKNVMGDLAETIESPANQLRILQQQFVLLARSIGNIIVPILNKVIPYINGFVQGLTTVFNQIALIFGFELGQGARDSANSISEVSSAVEETEDALKKTLLPFDKFLSLAQTETKDTSSSFTLEIPTYDALAGLDEINKKIEEISTNVKNFFLNIDDNGVIKGLSDNFYALLSVIETIITLKIIDWFTLLIAKMGEATLATKLLMIAQQLLQTAGIFLIIYSLNQLILNWDKLNTGMKIVYMTLTGLGIAMIAFSVMSKTKAIASISSLVLAFNTLTTAQKLATLGFSALGIAIGIGLFKALEGLDGKTKSWVGALFTLVGALTAVAIAVLAIQGALTLGIAIPIIVTAVSVGTAGLLTAINGSKEINGFATGGFTPEVTGSLFQAGENGRPELMGNVGGKNAVANVNSIETAMENASYRGMVKAISTASSTSASQKDIVLNIDGKELTRATIKDTANLLSKNYRVQVSPR